MMNKKKIMELVDKICATESTNCRSLNKSEEARKLMDIAEIPQNAVISEIPVDWNNQTIILFYLPNDDNYYSLFAGIDLSGKFSFELTVTGKILKENNVLYFDFFDNEKELPINFFKENKHLFKI